MTEIFNINTNLTIGLLDLKAYSSIEDLTSKREIEIKGRSFLINQLLNGSYEINYDEKGKPFLLNDSRHISISHSHDRLAIILNNIEPTGIDIEMIRDKVKRIKHKFLSDQEMEDAGDDTEKLLIYWAAKETLYKVYGLKEVDFIEHLAVFPFLKNQNGRLAGQINIPAFKESYELQYQILPGYVLVYAISKVAPC